MADSVPHPNSSPGTWLTDQMKRRNMGVRQLAEALGVSEKTIYEWRGDRTAISEVRVPELAQVFAITEVEARKGLGYWVPESTESARPRPDQLLELEEMRRALAQNLERLEEIIKEMRGR